MPENFLLYGFEAYVLSGVFTHSWGNRKDPVWGIDNRFIMHIADFEI
jgi:hypothetical protein